MKLKIQRCRTCGSLGVGPRAVKLYPLDDLLYCERGTPDDPGCYRLALAWHESRPVISLALQFELARPGRKRIWKSPNWQGYLEELSGMAGWALLVGDRKTFVYYFSRAVWAWALKEGT